MKPPEHVAGVDIGVTGIVVIGRNEGDRLLVCLEALARCGADPDKVVYVDSGSSDGSVERARDRGVHTVVLEAPYTAAKGRNAGYRFLLGRHPALVALQFVDGDCEYTPGWLEVATAALLNDDSIGAITGHQRERHPEATIYNTLVDVEWTGVIGDIDSCAGNVMIRAAVLEATGGYNQDLIAGEDPELYVRIKKVTGKRLVRIDEPMCLHDVDMRHFSQWWKRNVRAGHAYAQVSRMHSDGKADGFWKRETRSNFMWGAALPVLAPMLVPPAYLALFWKVYRHARGRGLDVKAARTYAFFTAIGKVPQALGQLKFVVNALRGEQSSLIEYK